MDMNRPCNNYPALKAYVDALCMIPAGSFVMGSAAGSADQRPNHSVRLSPFRIGATPVTVAVWKEYCAVTGVALPKAPEWGFMDDHPVINVSIVDILGADGNGGFCAWASDVAGFPLTLPTEAQWEYAARGGKNGLNYPWGNRFDHTKLWCSLPSVRRQTAPVIRRSNVFRNAFGLTDMVGNVLQLCSDWYGLYSRGPQTDPLGPKSSTENLRVARGASWGIDDPDVFQCALRFRNDPGSYSSHIGFRLVAAVKK
jgi:formylglycine-generating enzyme required for sulfatase activity